MPKLDQLSDRPARSWRFGDPLALALATALIIVSVQVGDQLLREGRPIVLSTPPLLAEEFHHWGLGSPLAVLCVLVGLRLHQFSPFVPIRRLLLAGWLLNLAWMCSLTLIDGIGTGWIDVLTDPNEYLHDLPRITDPAAFVRVFSDYIAFSPTVDGTMVWTTHVAGHPPLITLTFWALAKIGLGGGFWAGALCILVSSVVVVAMPVTLRELGAEAAARRAVPFFALFPGAVYMAVSADGIFAGVATGGLALATLGAVRRRPLIALAGGLLLGAMIFMNYGLILFGLVVVAVLIITVRRQGWRSVVVSWSAATVGFIAVIAIHLAYGFNWLTGLAQLKIRYYQGIASDRPFSYFVYANLAAWLIACSPLLALGIARALAAITDRRTVGWTQDRAVALIALCGFAMAICADLSALSKAETERIWLTFGVIAFTAVALLRGWWSRVVLVACAVSALVVNHVFDTGW